MWEQYFPCAKVFGWDWNPKQPPAGSTRTHVEQVDQLQLASLEAHSASKRFDLVIDDGDHRPAGMARTFVALWPLVRPGGYYIMEDVPTGAFDVSGQYVRYSAVGERRQRQQQQQPANSGAASPQIGSSGYAWVAHNHTDWPSALRRAYHENDVFFADTLVGSRNFESVRAGTTLVRDHVEHDSHVLVIRRRQVPRTRTVQMHGWRGR